MTEQKRCSKCGRMLPLTDFHKQTRAKDGLQSYCKDCRKVTFNQAPVHGKHTKPCDTSEALESIKHISSRILILALRERGYSGELTFTQKVTI